MGETVIYLLNRLRKHKKVLMDLYTNDEEFRSMCQAYYNSAITLEKMPAKYDERFQSQPE